MRSMQYVGLNKRAQDWLEDHCKKDRFELFKNGAPDKSYTKVAEVKDNKCQTLECPFSGELYTMSRYELKDGGYVYEKEQCSPWSSGPMVFTFLVDEHNVNIDYSLWQDAEINSVVDC